MNWPWANILWSKRGTKKIYLFHYDSSGGFFCELKNKRTTTDNGIHELTQAEFAFGALFLTNGGSAVKSQLEIFYVYLFLISSGSFCLKIESVDIEKQGQ